MIKKFNEIRCNITPCAINTAKKVNQNIFVLFYFYKLILE